MSVLRIIGIPPKATEPTTYSLARQAVRLYPRSTYTDRKAVNTLRAGWVSKIKYLGDRWLLHPSNSIQKRTLGHITPDMLVVLGTAAAYLMSLMIAVAP